MTASDFTNAIPLEAAVEQVKKLVPSNATLVGQAIQGDIAWLGLRQGRDFGDSFDLSEVRHSFMIIIKPSQGFASHTHTHQPINHPASHTLTSIVHT
eukprot:JZ554430.1.p1 GENE.JZ554430.1~~JZ554430.1.p1  ORF type:complete len:97 (+),score=19.23 JZ554430.1:237-527(+)